jgi:hypothetical protein
MPSVCTRRCKKIILSISGMGVALRKPIAMKRIAISLFGVSLLAITTLSCSKDVQNETAQQGQSSQVIQATVPAGETYVLNLGTGSSASIKAQARHFEVSEIATASNGITVYKYAAAKAFAGADEVTLQQQITSTSQQGGSCFSGGSSSHTTTSYKTIVVKFNVSN